jgi:hypothetical protein
MIEREIAAAERALREATEECLHRESTDEGSYGTGAQNNVPLESRIQSLQVQTQDLLFAHNMAEYYVKQQQQQQNGSAKEDDWQRLQALGTLVLSCGPNETTSPLYQRLLSEEYAPLHAYVRSHYQRQLRQELARIQYPSLSSTQWDNAGDDGGHNDQNSATLQTAARTLREIAILHDKVMAMGSSPPGHAPALSSQFDPVLPELCRPIVERVAFHFVPPALQKSHHASSKELRAAPPPPATLTRIDRLPEWLLGYLREHVFQPNGPWEFLLHFGLLDFHHGLNGRVGGGGGGTASSASDFLNELIRLVQWVLAERDFFRIALVSGPSSQPMVLCRAVEQLLQFDAFLQSEVLLSPLPDEGNKNGYFDSTFSAPASVLQRRRVVSLMDVCVAGDDELFAWWMNRERESVIATLFDPEAIVPVASDASAAACSRRVSPRAELCCALVQSVRSKAAVFTFSAPYIANVASPLCMRFVDALHETATDLTRQLTGRHLTARARNQVPANSELQRIVTAWIELINGAQMATQTLLKTTSVESDQVQSHSDGTVTSSDEDMARFGRSLERLQGAMLDDFVTSVVEVLIMERAKFAGYLMRCSHLLASASEDYIVGGINIAKLCDISPDLVETHRVMTVLLECFEASMMHVDNLDSFAPGLMLERVMSMIAEKLLEVALDLQGMTPDLLRPGCTLFARDVVALFGECPHLPNHALRVLDVVQLMRLESAQLGGIGGALCGLAGLPAPLTEADFEVDEKLFEEALSMIRAKGLVYVELADVFAVLNRRRDL